MPKTPIKYETKPPWLFFDYDFITKIFKETEEESEHLSYKLIISSYAGIRTISHIYVSFNLPDIQEIERILDPSHVSDIVKEIMNESVNNKLISKKDKHEISMYMHNVKSNYLQRQNLYKIDPYVFD